MTERLKAQLEKLFDNNTARVLDHFIIHEYFDYSSTELMRINEITSDELDKIMDTLANWKLITITTITSPKRYKLTQNDISFALKKLEFVMATET